MSFDPLSFLGSVVDLDLDLDLNIFSALLNALINAQSRKGTRDAG